MQPTLYDRGSKPLAESEVPLTEPAPEALPAARGVELTYPRMKAAADILRGHGIAFEDATDVFAGVEQPLYYDFCHFTREGNPDPRRAHRGGVPRQPALRALLSSSLWPS